MVEHEIIKSLDNRSKELRERFDSLGIKAVLFDFDDTLIHTTEMFAKFIKEYVDKVVEETNLDFETIDTVLRRINDEEYKTLGVSATRWNVVVEKMSREFIGNEEVIINNLNILLNIYNEKPRVRSGAKAALEGIKKTGVKIGLVTHANTDWTYRKLESTGFINYFDSILIANEFGHKGLEHWVSIMTDLNVTPSECLVIGDNLGGDIIPPSQIGARTIWLQKGSKWSMYRKGNVPENTMVINEISELLTALDSLR